MNYIGNMYKFYNSALYVWLYWFVILVIELIIIYTISKSIVYDMVHFNTTTKTSLVRNIKRVSSIFRKNAIVPIS